MKRLCLKDYRESRSRAAAVVLKKRRLGAYYKKQLKPIMDPLTVAKSLGVSRQLLDAITDMALFRLIARLEAHVRGEL